MCAQPRCVHVQHWEDDERSAEELSARGVGAGRGRNGKVLALQSCDKLSKL